MADVVAVSTNPAVDRIARVTGARAGGVLRADAFLETPGGKAAHVALVARTLGADARLVAPAGGRRGLLFDALLTAEELPATIVPVAGETRATYTVVDAEEGDVLEVHEPAEPLTARETERLVAAAAEAAAGTRVLVCAGSLPPESPEDLHARIVRAGRAAGAFTVLDTSSRAAALAALAEGPDLFAPNRDEAAALDPKGPSPERLRELGAVAVWLSLGAEGSLLSTAEGTWRLTPPAPRAVVNAVGCGDALLGGLAAGLVCGLDLVEAARLGTAAATDKLGRLHPAHVTRRSVEALCEHVTVDRLV